MTKFENLLFLPLELPSLGDINFDFLDSIELKDMFRDEYRNCYHINLIKSDLSSTKWLKELSTINSWLEKEVFPFFYGRVMIIVTPSHEANSLHIDCSPDKFDTLQHKFRYVLRGRVDSLRFSFADKKEKKIFQTEKPFIIEGRWPHHMINQESFRKYTIAIGYPWEPDLQNKKYLDLLIKSYEANKEKSIFINSTDKLPADWEQLFDKKYLGGKVPEWHKEI